jgi:hypothetical protein
MEPCDVVTGAMRLLYLGDDLVKVHRSGVDDACIRGAMRQYCFGDKGARVQANWATGDNVTTSECQKVGCARACADEVYGHEFFPCAKAQVASLSADSTRACSNTAPGPAAASADASATEPVRLVCIDLVDWVCVSMFSNWAAGTG